MPRQKSNPQIVLRPQDLVVLLRLALERGPAPTYAALAAELGMTASEIHGAVDRAVAAQLQGEAARLLQLGGDQRGDGGSLAEQLGDGRLIVAADLHLLPGIAEMDDGAANVEVFEQKAADGAVAHFSSAL